MPMGAHDEEGRSVTAGDLEVVAGDGTRLAVEVAGEGRGVVLLHGLTATRRYVVMGSRMLERSGCRVVAYDARGHGRSGAGPTPDAYTYDLLARDLGDVLGALGIERAVLAGASMGAQTALRFALEHPGRVAGLVLVTPAFDPAAPVEPTALARWDALARGMRDGGVEGFLAAYDFGGLPPRFRGTVERVVGQRLAAHEHPLAVADALEVVPRSRPFEDWRELVRVEVKVAVVGSRDEPDPEHPLAVAERYAASLPRAELLVEEPGESPLAWRGGRLSRVIAELAAGR
jgi:pimeloyl-ACP methyl ester carboxylesterase